MQIYNAHGFVGAAYLKPNFAAATGLTVSPVSLEIDTGLMSPAKHPVGEKIHINSSKNYTPLVSNVGTTPKETGTRGKTMTLVQHSRCKNLPRSRRLPLVDTGLAFASAVATPHGDILVRCRWVCSLQTREPTSAAAFIAALTTRIRRAVATRRLLLSGIKHRSIAT